MQQVARNLTDVNTGSLNGSRYLIHDRDPVFTEAFRAHFSTALRVETVKVPLRSPNLNAYAERCVHSTKSECLARIIPLGGRHRRNAVAEYTEHYHTERKHQGLGNQLILKPRDNAPAKGNGGLLQYYYRRAA